MFLFYYVFINNERFVDIFSLDFITANFPHVTVPQVKQRMGNKLRDKRQLHIRTASLNSAHWMLQQS